MAGQRKRYGAALKAKVALEAIKGQRTVSEIASEYGVHPNLITKWKKLVIEESPGIFSDKKERIEKQSQELESELYRQIGQLKVELDWLKKKSGY
jgi:transposase-like protein